MPMEGDKGGGLPGPGMASRRDAGSAWHSKAFAATEASSALLPPESKHLSYGISPGAAGTLAPLSLREKKKRTSLQL